MPPKSAPVVAPMQTLIRTALRENYDVRVAAARILEARAQVTVTRSALFPEPQLGADSTFSHIEGKRSPLQFEETLVSSGGLDLGFELDFWGRVRRATEAARDELFASEAARRVVVTTLVSDVAAAYVQLRELDRELEIGRQTLAARRESLRLVRLRASGGVAAMIDVHQGAILSSRRPAWSPTAERLIEQTENALNVLLGHQPDAVPRGQALEAQLATATARIGVAKADYFPRVFLTGSARAGGLTLDGSIFGPQGLCSIGRSITLPLFNAGRVRAGVEFAEASADAALAQYRQTMPASAPSSSGTSCAGAATRSSSTRCAATASGCPRRTRSWRWKRRWRAASSARSTLIGTRATAPRSGSSTRSTARSGRRRCSACATSSLPEDIYKEGVRRYGFHGLSYEFIARRLPEVAPEAARGAVVVCHLGSGASMCALRAGRSMDSTMGFTALDGLPMGTRCGQLDPGVVLYLMTEKGYAAMEGLDAVVFTAGIGENSPEIRARVAARAAWLGLRLDDAANRAGGPRISTPDSRVSAWVIPTDEERMIAEHTVDQWDAARRATALAAAR